MLALKKWFRTESQMHMHMFYMRFLQQLSFHCPESSLFFICPLHLQYYLLFLKNPTILSSYKAQRTWALSGCWDFVTAPARAARAWVIFWAWHDSMRHYFLMQTHSDLRCTQYIKSVMYAKTIPIREEVNKFVMILMICILNVTSAEQLGSEGSDLCSVPRLSWGMVLLPAFITVLQ